MANKLVLQLWDGLFGQDLLKMKDAMSKGANPSTPLPPGNNGKAALWVAVDVNYLGLPYVDALLEGGADPNQATDDGVTPLLHAVKQKKWDIVERLLQAPGIDINKKDRRGSTPLLFAVGNPAIVKLLLDAGADPNAPGIGKVTPYINAIGAGDYVSASNILAKAISNGISKDAVVNAKTDERFNAAFDVKDVKGVEQVVSDGVDINMRMPDGETPLIHAIRVKRDPTVAIALVNNGADVNASLDTGNNALLLAMDNPGYTSLVQVLVDNRANVNIQNKRGNTPLMFAASRDNAEYVQLLLEKGADKTLKDASGKTALDYTRDPDIKDLLSGKSSTAWTGTTSSDADLFNTFFEDKENWSCCPVCLSYVQRSEACRYMSHDCTKVAGVIPHTRLYELYKNSEGIIAWCTICGRICRGHRHYQIASHSQKKLPPLAPIKSGMTPFGGEQECIRDGGLGFPEKVSRFDKMLSKLKELQPEVGKITETRARRIVVETAWDAPFQIVPFKQILQTSKFTTRPEEFPAPVAPGAPVGPAPDIPKPADEVANVPEVIGEGGFDAILRYETAPVIRFIHKKKDGTVYRHTDQELVSKDGLEAFIDNQNTNFGTDKFGYCFAPGCDAKLWPQDITDFIDDRDVFEEYRTKFNEKFRAKVGGQGKNFLVEMTNAECAKPEKAGRRKTYRRRGHKKTGRSNT